MSFRNKLSIFFQSERFRKSPILLLVILGFAVLTRFYNIENPQKYYFDEVYHAITIKYVAENNPWAFEWWHPPIEPGVMIDWLHPPLAKYIQAIGVLIFGFNSFGWRVGSAAMGVGIIFLTYHLGKILFSKKVGLLAAFIVSLDGLLLVQSRIAMNDVHVTFFILATLILYRYYRNAVDFRKITNTTHQLILFFLVASSSGLALATKWSGFFVLAAVGLSELFYTLQTFLYARKKLRSKSKSKFSIEYFKRSVLLLIKTFIPLIGKGVLMLFIPAAIYIASYGQAFLQGKDFQYFKDLHNQIWRYQTTLNATHTYESRPWQWFFNMKPIWYSFEYEDSKSTSNIYAFGNPGLHLFGISAVLASCIWILTIKKKKSLNLVWLVFVYFFLWLPWQFSPRIMFYYHYLPAVPVLSVILSFWLARKSNTVLFLILGFIFVCFLIWYPLWAGLPAPAQFEALYVLIKS